MTGASLVDAFSAAQVGPACGNDVFQYSSSSICWSWFWSFALTIGTGLERLEIWENRAAIESINGGIEVEAIILIAEEIDLDELVVLEEGCGAGLAVG